MSWKKYKKWLDNHPDAKNKYGIRLDDEHYFEKTFAAMYPKPKETIPLPEEYWCPDNGEEERKNEI